MKLLTFSALMYYLLRLLVGFCLTLVVVCLGVLALLALRYPALLDRYGPLFFQSACELSCEGLIFYAFSHVFRLTKDPVE